MDKNQKIDAYLKTLPDDRRKALEALREVVAEAGPELLETDRYNMPTYELNEHMVCAFKAQKHYMSLYMDVELVEAHRVELGPLNIGKSCIRFKRLEDLPLEVVSKIVRKTIEKQSG